MHQYRVVPFIGTIKGEKIAQVSEQLQKLIEDNERQGWEFYSIERVGVLIKQGCLAAFFGSPTRQIDYDQVIFRKANNGQ